ncbi:MAG: diaminopimelate epimerase [Bacteroidetes bacterium]|nr:diaminopimelate epimerase [Bacteroidota bacterium]
MTIQFYKFQGTGNDFIISDNRNGKLVLSSLEIKKLCDRRFGIGADGFIILNSIGQNYEMVYYNSDGQIGSMCGNGGRCIIAFSHYIGISNKTFRFSASDGVHEGEIVTQSDQGYRIKLKMNNTSDYSILPNHYEVNTGSPHYVKFIEDIEALDVFTHGKEIRYSKVFKDNGINVNFVGINNNKELFVRTYERGVENETLSCGTGVTASVLAYALQNKIKAGDVHVKTLGGTLSVSFELDKDTFRNIWLEGPATLVYKGKIEI